MSIRPDGRRRLAELMEARRLDLGLYWQDVVDAAVAAGFRLSLKTLHTVRAGDAGIRPMTQRAIETGLQWEHGSIQRIEDGGDPVDALPAVALPAPPPVLEPAPDPGDDVTGAVVAALFGPKERKIWAHIRRHLEASPVGAALFADPAQAALWPAEAPDGFSGGAPFDLSAEARELLDAIPATELFTDPYEVVIWRMNTLRYRKRVGMIREYREPVRGAGTARRAGLKKPDGLTA